MKKGFWKKVALFLSVGLGGMMLTACQTTNPSDAKVVINDHQQISIYTDTSRAGSPRVATTTIGVKNGSIFDVLTWDFTVTAYDDENQKLGTVTYNESMFVQHGASGYVTLLKELNDKDVEVQKVKSMTLDKVVMKDYRNVWDTYIGWWVAGIVIVSISLIFFAVELFSNKLTSDQAKELFRNNVASTVCISAFILILCLFPLIWGAWVPTVILTISMVASLLVSGIMTGIKALAVKNK